MDPHRIAVLPMVNISPDPSDAYFADGLTEELISTLSKISELSVISRTSITGYKGTTKKIRDIGGELGAGSVLEGSFRKSGNKIRVTAQLISVDDDRHVWSESYDRNLDDVFEVQTDIAKKVADALRVKILSPEVGRIDRKPTDSTKAYTLYLRARVHWNERTLEGVKKAIRYFEEAIRLDPDFALAYSGLADCYSVQEDRGWASHSETGPLAEKYAEKALYLDSELAEGHASFGLVLKAQWDLAGAEREFRKAIALNPNYATAYHWYANLLRTLERCEEALDREKDAFELDPYSSIIIQGIGICLLFLNRVREAIAQFEKLGEADPGFESVHVWKAWAHERVGEFDKAIEEAKRASGVESHRAIAKLNLASIYARAGQREQAIKLFEEVQSNSSADQGSPAYAAMVKFDLGENEEAFRWLERAFQDHDGYLLYFKEFPWCKAYRSDSRWLAIERRMNLSP